MNEIDEIVREFLVESHENLERYDQALLDLENAPDDAESLGSIFRTLHTLKGMCGFLDYPNLEELAHAAESLLSLLRDGVALVDEDIASGLLATGDTIRASLIEIETTGREADPTPRLIARLEGLQARVVAGGDDRLGAMLVDEEHTEPDHVDTALWEQETGDDRPIGEILVHTGAATADAVREALQRQAGARGGLADTTVRVDVGLLDDLMNRVGELVLVRNEIVQEATTTDLDARLARASQRLSLITTELQESVMRTRMQPIGTAWSKLPRVVRDLAVQTGKHVRVEMEGEDTELDKSLVEAIRDPLTHLVRNAVDHGIETPEERAAAGKPDEGSLLLRAFHGGGQVHLEIVDDGAGIDVERLRARAVDRGIVTPQQAQRLDDRGVRELVFAAGFSTAEHVTSVSGRGVGMDVVRTNIEAIGGAVDVRSTVGVGTTFALAIPLTLAIIPALVVTTFGQRYAIPQVNLLELVRVTHDRAHEAVEFVHGAPVHRLRGRLLPLVHLSDALALPGGRGPAGSAHTIVVLQADGHRFGLVVDGIDDSVEIVVKPLARHLTSIATFAGATILGDGTVGLILDVAGLARQTGVAVGTAPPAEVEDGQGGSATTSLLVCAHGPQRVAVPLSAVDRLETVDASRVERIGGREVVQYRGALVPMIRLESLLPSGGHGPPAEGSLDVVVHATDTGPVGVVVDEILGVVEVDADTTGRTGARVVDGRATEVVDLDQLLARAGTVAPILTGA